MTPRIVLRTPRLRLRELQAADAPFVLAMLTDPDFLRHVGDRGVRDLETAKRWIADKPQAGYAAHGFGLWLAELDDGATPAGLCGLLRRDTLEAPDLGYAWLPAYRGRGLAREAAAATLAHAFGALGLARVLAITTEGNAASRRVLETIGMACSGLRDIDGEPLLVYAAERTPG